jgi:hypothetical protein
VQGFNFVIPSAAIRDFLKGTEVRVDGRSAFNAAWHQGLADFFAGHHAKGARALREANRLLPELPDVRRPTAENDERIKHPPPCPFPWARVAAMMLIASALGLGWRGVARWKRNQFRIRPAEVAQLLETSPEPPILLDVRSSEAYDQSPVRLPRARHVAPRDLAKGPAALSISPDRMVVAYCA